MPFPVSIAWNIQCAAKILWLSSLLDAVSLCFAFRGEMVKASCHDIWNKITSGWYKYGTNWYCKQYSFDEAVWFYVVPVVRRSCNQKRKDHADWHHRLQNFISTFRRGIFIQHGQWNKHSVSMYYSYDNAQLTTWSFITTFSFWWESSATMVFFPVPEWSICSRRTSKGPAERISKQVSIQWQELLYLRLRPFQRGSSSDLPFFGSDLEYFAGTFLGRFFMQRHQYHRCNRHIKKLLMVVSLLILSWINL